MRGIKKGDFRKDLFFFWVTFKNTKYILGFA